MNCDNKTPGPLRPIYAVPIDEIDLVPSDAGVYVLFDTCNLYCGFSTNLKRRFPEVRRYFGVGDYFFYISDKLFSDPRKIINFLALLEVNTISTLNTVIYGQGLPLALLNKKGVDWLPRKAWMKDRTLDYQLAIDITQTVLFCMGVPLHMTTLPWSEAIATTIPLRLYERNKKIWRCLLETESVKRMKPGSCRPPLVPISPDFHIHRG